MSKKTRNTLIVLGFIAAVIAGFFVASLLNQSPARDIINSSSKISEISNNNSQKNISIKKYSAGEIFSTYLNGETGKIAVSVVLPSEERFVSGAPVIVYVPTSFTPDISDFSYLDGLEEQGIIQVTLMYPGRSDKSGVKSEGQDDYGGENSIKALRDVILFAAGEKKNSEGYYLNELSQVNPDFDNLGLYAFSHPGIIATNVMALYGSQLSAVKFFVGRENPTMDLLNSLEIGHYTNEKKIVFNPAYSYPDNYSSTNISLDYSSVHWSIDLNVPYFDFNNDDQPNGSDYIFGSQVPQMFGKRVYSDELLFALRQNGLSETAWPNDLATPEEAEDWWSDNRETIEAYSELEKSSFKVMLVFNVADHVQTALDKPHIHQAYDGFHKTADMWVRLNPDQAYVVSLSGELKNYNEHSANTEPDDWSEIGLWAFSSKIGNALVPVAAVLEMVDRTHSNNWQNDLTTVIK